MKQTTLFRAHNAVEGVSASRSPETPMTEKQSVPPDLAVDEYLTSRSGELADKTIEQHRNTLRFFKSWCENEGDIESLDELDGNSLMRFKQWRADGVKPITLQTEIKNLRVFLKWAARAEYVQSGIYEKIHPVQVRQGEEVNNKMIEKERAEEVLEFLRQYRFASRDHAMFLLIWRTAIRTGTVRALDLDDVELDSKEPFIRIRHRPETDTPLKNGTTAEREININDTTAEVLGEYIDRKRKDVRDEHDREPLFTTAYGRIKRPSIRRTIYGVTRPCVYAGVCPHDRDPEECEHAGNRDGAAGCPDSVSGHPMRRGSITAHLREDVPAKIVSDRADVSEDVLSKHYDQMTESEKRKQRREYLNNI